MKEYVCFFGGSCDRVCLLFCVFLLSLWIVIEAFVSVGGTAICILNKKVLFKRGICVV